MSNLSKFFFLSLRISCDILFSALFQLIKVKIKVVIHKRISTLKGWQIETKNYMSYIICLSIIHHIRILPIVAQVSLAYECAEGDCPLGASKAYTQECWAPWT